MYRIEYSEDGLNWYSASCDFEDTGTFENIEDAEIRTAELNDENEDILFRVVEC